MKRTRAKGYLRRTNEFIQVGRRKTGKPPDFKLFGAGSREVRDGRETSLGNAEVVVDAVVPGCVGPLKPLGITAERAWVVDVFDVEGTGTLLGPLAEVEETIVDFSSADPGRGPSEISTRRGP